MKKTVNLLTIRYSSRKVLISFRNQEKLVVLKYAIVRQYLTDLITERGTELELDLTGVKFIDNEGFDTLNLLARLGKKFNSILVLKGVEKEVIEMMELARKYYVFDVRHIEPVVVPI